MEIDDNTRDLLVYQLTEKIEATVRGRLFKFYGAVGGVALTALGFFGYNVVEGLNTEARRFAHEAVRPSVKEANDAASSARKLADEASVQLKFMSGWMSDRAKELAKIEEEVSVTLGRVGSVTEKLQARIDDMTAKIGDTDSQIKAQQERAREMFAGAGNVDSLKEDIATLTEEVAALQAGLKALGDAARAGGTATPVPPVAQPTPETFMQLAQKYTAFTEQKLTAPVRVTVYVQFAGVKREEIAAVSALLAQRGYDMPGAERLGSATGLHEVRFFFDEDAKRAAQAAADINVVLAAAGYQANVKAKDTTGFTGAKPRPGTLELWLEPKPAP